MIDALRLYLRYVGISIRAQMQYRASFLMIAIGQFLTSGIEFAAIWALFQRFQGLRGWSLPEVALLYGAVHISFGLAEMLARGFDLFGSTMVKSGQFDRLLLRPRGSVLQLMGQEVQLARIGRITQGLAVLGWACASVEFVWSPARVVTGAAAIAGGAALFSGLFVLQATMSFWTVESLEIANITTDGGVETAQYPMSIYNPWFRRFFTFVVPLACINYLPALAILGRTSGWLMWLSPLAGFAFVAAALRVWRFGVRHYCSTGS